MILRDYTLNAVGEEPCDDIVQIDSILKISFFMNYCKLKQHLYDKFKWNLKSQR